MNITAATLNDIPILVTLINSAYRGEESKKGWTTEANLLEGSARTDAPTLTTLMNKPGVSILKWSNNLNNTMGCVFLQKQNAKLYLGMLTVSPNAQAAGIGKQLLTAAEEYAKQNNCHSIMMNVISVRHELIEWYERRGYQKTGITKPFPSDTKFGIPKQPLEFVELEKNLKI